MIQLVKATVAGMFCKNSVSTDPDYTAISVQLDLNLQRPQTEFQSLISIQRVNCARGDCTQTSLTRNLCVRISQIYGVTYPLPCSTRALYSLHVSQLRRSKGYCLTPRPRCETHWRFADSVDQDQTATYVQSDLGSTLYTFFCQEP